MPKGELQKCKLLYINKILLEESDENNPLSTRDIIDRLAEYGISAERKAIYSDLSQLEAFGVDIVKVGGSHTRYFIGRRDFELAELKLLVDAVQSSKFITEKKSSELIAKLATLASRSDRGLLQRQVYVRDRIKAMNESIYYNVDELNSAILSGKKISFSYYHYALDFGSLQKLKKFYRKELYITSPLALSWDDENYYLVAFDDQRIKHYRVDKMENIRMLREKCDVAQGYSGFNTAAYSKQVFGMFGGELTGVKLWFDNSLIGVAVDRFGKDAAIYPFDEGHFTLNTKVVISPQFFGWLAGFGDMVKLISPESAVLEYKEMTEKIADLYKLEE